MKSFIKSIFYLLFAVVAMMFILTLFVLWYTCESVCIYDYFGIIVCIIFVLLITAVVVSPFWLKKHVKTELLIPLISIMLVIILAVAFMLLYYVADKHFQIYTAEKWRDFPNQRMRMIEDLKTNYSIIGASDEDVKILLGTPDETDYYEEVTIFKYYYDCGYIECYINQGELDTIRNVDY